MVRPFREEVDVMAQYVGLSKEYFDDMLSLVAISENRLSPRRSDIYFSVVAGGQIEPLKSSVDICKGE